MDFLKLPPIFRFIAGAGLWRTGTCVVALVAVLPVLAIIWMALLPAENIWPHLISTSLPRYLYNTLVLMAGVGLTVFLTGVTTAHLITAFDFPFRKQLEILLLLPLAFPAYVMAYLYTDLLEYAGPIQTLLREIFGWELARDYWFPNIRSMGGAILLMGLVLYPYVYLLTKASFLEQPSHLRDASRLMGHSHFKTFFFISLPIARPAIATGVALALMETINDFGTVDFFSIQTLSTGLFDVWLNMNNLGGAAQVSMVMLGFVMVLIAIEYLSRRKARFYQTTGRFDSAERHILSGYRKWGAVLLCLIPVGLGFIIPIIILIQHSINYMDKSWTPVFKSYIFNSLSVSMIAAVCCALIAILINYTRRLYSGKLIIILSRLAAIGYAIPGAVLAVGIVVPMGLFDNTLDTFLKNHFGLSSGLLFSGTIFALVMAYIIRFLAISIGSVESSFSKVSTSIDMAARTLGYSPFRTLRVFHFPLIKGGIITAALIVFVDCMKELPATLLLRPFNFETLATHVYLIASTEQIEQAALGSLFLVLAGLIPVVVLSRTISYSQILPRTNS